jgi:toxin HigB-1
MWCPVLRQSTIAECMQLSTALSEISHARACLSTVSNTALRNLQAVIKVQQLRKERDCNDSCCVASGQLSTRATAHLGSTEHQNVLRIVTRYATLMIDSFTHKGLKDLYETGSIRGVQASQATRLRKILTLLDHATSPGDLMIPTYRTHKLSGPLRGYWSMTVNDNWRVVFRFHNHNVESVDLVDYH